MSMIGLLDCNNFFVSCQRLFRPDLEGKPVAVLSSNDGCVVARSQEVKDLGIAMGVPLFQVKDIVKKEDVILFSGNAELYRDISARVMRVLAQEVGQIEVYSIDEAFFVLSDSVTYEEVYVIRDVVMKSVGIPVSIGVAQTKTLAKQASAIGKKTDGVCILKQKDWQERSTHVQCGEIWGLGRQTVTKLSQMDVHTAHAYMSLERSVIISQFGIAGERVYDELHGISVKNIENKQKTAQQSITSTKSFKKTTTDPTVLESTVAQHVSESAKKLRTRGVVASKLSVQIQTDRFSDFFLQGDSIEVLLQEPTACTSVLLTEALRQVRRMYTKGVPYKKTGITLSGLMPESYRTEMLFSNLQTMIQHKTLDTVMDDVNRRFGKGSIQSAVIQVETASSYPRLQSPSYTTQWKDIPTIQV